MFISVIAGNVQVWFVYFNFNVTEIDGIVLQFPKFLFSLFLGVIDRFSQSGVNRAIDNKVSDDNVGDEHNDLYSIKRSPHLGF
jgi:hypothetical protein